MLIIVVEKDNNMYHVYNQYSFFTSNSQSCTEYDLYENRFDRVHLFAWIKISKVVKNNFFNGQ